MAVANNYIGAHVGANHYSPLPFPIVDSHLHVWDPNHLAYPWLNEVPMLNKPHLPADYNQACGPVDVGAMVFIQCECAPEQFYDEAQWVAGLAEEDRRIRGIVPWAPLEKGEGARKALERMVALPLVKGVRRIIQFEPDIEFCLRPDFVRGVQLCSEFDLHFEICVDYRQMENTIKMVRQCPDVRFILDHIGKPNIKGHMLEPWRAQIKALAEMPNVWCKMSGLATEADWTCWTRADLMPYINAVLESFGFDRTIFGSDWPVATQATAYPRWVETLDEAVRGCSADELERLFRRNAIRFYRLEI